MTEHTTLTQYLAWDSNNDFGIPVPSELIRKLEKDYDTEIRSYLDILKEASLEERKEFYKQIYETLYLMAAQDDAASIYAVFELCPDMKPEGYYAYDQYLPLGEAILRRAYHAIDALLACGCDINMATFAPVSTLEFAIGNDCPEEMIDFLREKGAE